MDRKRKEYFGFLDQYFGTRLQEQHQHTFHQIHIDVPRMNPLIPLFQEKIVQEVRYHTLLPATVRYCTLLSGTVRYCTLLYLTVRYCTLLYLIVCYSPLLYVTVPYCMLLSATVRYCTLLIADTANLEILADRKN